MFTIGVIPAIRPTPPFGLRGQDAFTSTPVSILATTIPCARVAQIPELRGTDGIEVPFRGSGNGLGNHGSRNRPVQSYLFNAGEVGKFVDRTGWSRHSDPIDEP